MLGKHPTIPHAARYLEKKRRQSLTLFIYPDAVGLKQLTYSAHAMRVNVKLEEIYSYSLGLDGKQ